MRKGPPSTPGTDEPAAALNQEQQTDDKK